MKTLIVGNGQIGNALFNVLSEYYDDIHIIGKVENKVVDGSVDIMHVCFPYSNDFVSEVNKYRTIFNPRNIIIHSTVPVGTSKKLEAIHSPVIGIHPKLEVYLKTFIKFLGGRGGGRNIDEVAEYFRKADFKIYTTDKSETTELMKILCTTKYGIDIEFAKEVKRLCDKNEVPFEAWVLWTKNYNKGYGKLGQGQYVRPNLVPMMDKIGGHCVLPNAELLESEFTEFILKLNQ